MVHLITLLSVEGKNELVCPRRARLELDVDNRKLEKSENINMSRSKLDASDDKALPSCCKGPCLVTVNDSDETVTRVGK